MGRIDSMVGYAVAVANDDWHGYSQADRWYQDRDCSSLMYDSANYAGYPVGRGADAVRYTGTMLADFTDAGFTAIPFSQVGLGGLKRGDILLNVEHHTEMYIGDGLNVGAHSSETGGIYGQPGDQTGNEISVTETYVYWDGWDFVLRPPAEDQESEEFNMTEALFHMDDNHEGYQKGDIVYWNPTAGFCYLEDVDCVNLIKKCSPDIAYIHSAKAAPWVWRAKQATNPAVAQQTYGKRD